MRPRQILPPCFHAAALCLCACASLRPATRASSPPVPGDSTPLWSPEQSVMPAMPPAASPDPAPAMVGSIAQQDAAPASEGSLEIEVHGGSCDVVIDGRAFGPARRQRLVLPVGMHQVRCLRPEGGGPVQHVRLTGQGALVAFKLL